MTDCVLITSVISPTVDPLNYGSPRSVYSQEERAAQTDETISSVRRKFPKARVCMIECSPKNSLLKNLSRKVDLFINLYPDDFIRANPNKSLGEARMMMAGLINGPTKNCRNIFKITGRYVLLPEFDPKIWRNNRIQARLTDHYGGPSVHTFFYKIPFREIDVFRSIYLKMLRSRTEDSLERVLFQELGSKISHVDQLGVLARWSSYNHANVF